MVVIWQFMVNEWLVTGELRGSCGLTMTHLNYIMMVDNDQFRADEWLMMVHKSLVS